MGTNTFSRSVYIYIIKTRLVIVCLFVCIIVREMYKLPLMCFSSCNIF